MKKYWIEKIEYPNGVEGFADCIPYGDYGYEDKQIAIGVFMCLVQDIKDDNDKTSCASLYEIEDDYDTRIRIYDNGIITNEGI